ncbi:MAG: multicopper oxidase domain-containing protein [Pseudomonadota bacterium]
MYRYSVLGMMSLAAGLVSAQDAPHGSAPAVNPPSAAISYATYASPSDQIMGEAAAARDQAGTVEWSASVEYTDGEIYNPTTGRMDKVQLRSYQGEGVNPEVPFMPPTIVLRPGDTFRLNLTNNLPMDDPSCVDHGDVNIPSCFNLTNMHTHGLWVSPSGNADNVLLSIGQGQTFSYEYNVPADHAAGTFWYHPHMHGSTALQVSSGMAGALIVKGNRLPGAENRGDIDTLLKSTTGAPVGERLVVLTQIAYACGEQGDLGVVDIKRDEDGFWVCDPGDVGRIEGYNQFGLFENFDTPTGIPEIKTRWQESGRHTTLNGRVLPTFSGVTAGEIERWRFIQAGISGSMSVSFRKYTGETPDADYRAGTADARDNFVGDNCGGEDISQFSIALDGLTRDRINEQPRTNLHPGYRDDVLIAFPEPGLYCIVDNDAPRQENIRNEAKQRQILGFVVVDGQAGALGEATAREYVQDFLVSAAQIHMPSDVRDEIVADLGNLEIPKFVAYDTLLNREPDGQQTLGFDTILVEDAPKNEFVVGNLELTEGELPKLINAAEYETGVIHRQLTLDDMEEWILAAFLEGHPFHKHVNPIQIVSIIDPDTGIDVSAFGSGSVYAGLKGQWKDTVFLPTNVLGEPFVVTVRSHYRRYIGTFVLHCHILDHEDWGMMQVVDISLPSTGHSHH